MVDFHGNKKRLSISLSLFAPNDYNVPKKSPKSFQPNGVVGLGIVAALSELDQTHDPYFSVKSSRAAILAVSPKSNPIPILNPNSFVPKIGWSNLKDDQIELSEEYTCVISHTGDNLIKKREYYDGILANESETTTSYWGGGSDSGMAVEKSPRFLTADFLNSCNLCKKLLHGLDIFMYRGERAFCSAECRCKQIAMEERKEKEKEKEKCGSGAMKTTSLDQCSSASPCSSPMQFFAGVAAA